MMYTYPDSSDPFFHFESDFTPWTSHEPDFLFDPTSPLNQEPVFKSPELVSPNSGSDGPIRKRPSSGSDSLINERKHRRMISNRESARRSRMRKQKHLENMRNQLSLLKVANHELMNRIRFAVQQNQLVRSENECLRSEVVMLRQRLWDMRQVLLVRQRHQHLNPSAWPCNNLMSVN